MSEIVYEIVKKVGVLSRSTSGWAKELNLISWNDREPKYDLRDWSPDRRAMEVLERNAMIRAGLSVIGL